MSNEVYAGVMTGTSIDGVDVVIADFTSFPSVLIHRTFQIPNSLKSSILHLATEELVNIELLGRAHFTLGQLYARSILDTAADAGIFTKDIRAVGIHGQTVRHRPQQKQLTSELEPIGMTLQIGSGPVTAALTGIDVVSDFRSADIAVGGEGAPLVPMFDNVFLRSDTSHRIILNIGGIANITSLPLYGDVTAFDTGPGNMVIDTLMQRFYGKPFDEDGSTAHRGEVSTALLEELLHHPFFKRSAPKSTGREEFGTDFVEFVISRSLELSVENADSIATVTELTARTISDAIHSVAASERVEIIASGGGIHNKTLMRRLTHYLPDAKIITTDEIGIPTQAKEALAFAFFAKAFIDNKIIHLPMTTGASSYQILGSLSKGKM